MKCLDEFTKWNGSINLHAVVHQSEVWSAAWSACEAHMNNIIAELEREAFMMRSRNERLEDEKERLLLDLYFKDKLQNG